MFTANLGPGGFSPGSVSILLGQGDGTFHPSEDFVVEPATAMALRDFNRDGRPDLAIANSRDNIVSILLNARRVVNDLVTLDAIPSSFTFSSDTAGVRKGPSALKAD